MEVFIIQIYIKINSRVYYVFSRNPAINNVYVFFAVFYPTTTGMAAVDDESARGRR